MTGKEIDLLKNYPKSNRNLNERVSSKTEHDREIARRFDKDFFDGDRKHGYGGFTYNPRFWSEVVKDIYDYYNLSDGSSILDVGCAKGYMLYDFSKLNSHLDLTGIDISEYAINNSIDNLKDKLTVGCASDLPYQDNSFDLVISINTIHNLELTKCSQAIKEIQRVSKKFSFLTVDAYRNEEEKDRMYAWNLTAKTIFSVPEWKNFFKDNNYTGDYYWFIP